jgi:hypothetical protein
MIFPYIIISKGIYIGSNGLTRFIGEPLRDFSESTSTKWLVAAQKKKNPYRDWVQVNRP